MAVGLTIRFQRGEDGRPLVMYIRDLLGTCPACGLEVVQRTYDEVSYHHLTAARFRELLRASPDRLEWVCEQCGEGLDASNVGRWSLTYGFPGETGLIQGFGQREQDEVVLRYSLSPYRAFDGQMLPQWEIENDQSVAVVETLSEEDVRGVLGRYLSLKAGWRRALKRHLAGSAQLSVVELASGYVGLIGPTESMVRRACDRLSDASDRGAGGKWVCAWLADDLYELVDDGPRGWLPETWYERLKTGQVWAVAAADLARGRRALEEVLAGLPGPTSHEVDDALVARVTFPMGSDEAHTAEVSLPSLMLEAAVVAAAPSDWVRLWLDDTLAEMVGGLGGVRRD